MYLDDIISDLLIKKDGLNAMKKRVKEYIDSLGPSPPEPDKERLENWLACIEAFVTDVVNFERSLRKDEQWGGYKDNPKKQGQGMGMLEQADNLRNEAYTLGLHLPCKLPVIDFLGMERSLEEIRCHLLEYWTPTTGICHSLLGRNAWTPLLRAVYNFAIDLCMFDCQIWVNSSQSSDVCSMQRKILQSLGVPQQDGSIENQADTIFRALQGKTCLLAINNITQPLDLKQIGIPYPWKVVFAAAKQVANQMREYCLTGDELSIEDKDWKLFHIDPPPSLSDYNRIIFQPDLDPNFNEILDDLFEAQVELLERKKHLEDTILNPKEKVTDWVDSVDDFTNRLDNLAEEEDTSELEGKCNKMIEKARKLRIEAYMPLSVTEAVVGMEKYIKQLQRYLWKEKKLRIGIHEIPGSGKTTLMRIFYNYIIDWYNFDYHIWVTVSQGSDIRSLQKQILESLRIPTQEDGSIKSQATTISKALQGKTCLLAIDDVEEKLDLDVIGIPGSGSEYPCYVVFATSSITVAYTMGHKVITINSLTKEDAWELFCIHAGKTVLSQPEIKRIGEQIVERCRGLPLALVTIGRMVATVTTEDEWQKVLSLHCPDRLPVIDFLGMRESFEEIITDLLKYWAPTTGICDLSAEKSGGRTTLLKAVYNFSIERCMFDCKIWVNSSQSSDICSMQRKILQSLGIPQQDGSIENQADTIFKALQGKTCLLAIDNITQPLDLKQIGIPYPWKVVFTAAKQVADQMREYCLTGDELSSEEKGWKLFHVDPPHSPRGYYWIGSHSDLDANLNEIIVNLFRTQVELFDRKKHLEDTVLNPKEKVRDWMDRVDDFMNRMDILVVEDDTSELEGKCNKMIEEARKLRIETYMPATVMEAVVGMETYLEELERCLWKEKELRIGIYGIPGSGKTMLMRIFFNNIIDWYNFDRHIWVTVSQGSDTKSIQKQILESLRIPTQEDGSIESQATTISKALQGKTCLLVIDDVKVTLDLNAVGLPGSVSRYPCYVVFSTSGRNVAETMGDKVVTINSLSEKKSWELFCIHAGNIVLSWPEIKRIGEQIVERCGGLPLALVTIGRMVATMTTEDEWQKVLDSLISSDSDVLDSRMVAAGVQILFENIDDELHIYFLFCCLFPKNYWFNREELRRYWIGLGLGYHENTCGGLRRLHDKGNDVIDQLIAATLLQEGNTYPESEVTVDDAAHWVGLNVLGKPVLFEPCRQLTLTERWKDIWGVSLVDSKLESLDADIHCPDLTMLLLKNNIYLRNVSDNIFQSSEVQFLDLSHTCIRKIPANIGNCVELMYLDLSFTKITSLPKEVGQLVNLRHLGLEGTKFLSALPGNVLSQFSELIVLNMIDSFGDWEVQECLGEESKARMEELEMLASEESLLDMGITLCSKPAFDRFLGSTELRNYTRKLLLNNCQELETFHLSSVLKNINKLNISNCRSISEFIIGGTDGTNEEEDEDNLESKTYEEEDEVGVQETEANEDKLESKTYEEDGEVGVQEIETDKEETETNEEEIETDGLGLEVLELVGLFQAQISFQHGSMASQFLQKLREITIDSCYALKDITWASQLGNLEHLSLYCCKKLECVIGKETNEGGHENPEPFQKLKTMSLHKQPRLKAICKGTLEFPYLETLTVLDCPQLTTLPLRVECVERSLKMISGEQDWWDDLEWENESVESTLNKKFQPVE